MYFLLLLQLLRDKQFIFIPLSARPDLDPKVNGEQVDIPFTQMILENL